MAGLVPAIHVYAEGTVLKTWIPPEVGLPDFQIFYKPQVG
jgi:hypothetical protein